MEHVLSPIVVFLVVFAGGRFLRHLLMRSAAIRKDPQVKTLVHNVVSAATFVFAALGGLVAAGINISILITFGGLFSLAIGLAFQDVLRNLLAGMFLLVEQPFRLGDNITVGEYMGTVETIQLRTTALHTVDGRLVIVPNLAVFNVAVVNNSAFEARRFEIVSRVSRDADVEHLLRRSRAVLLATKSLARQPTPAVSLQLDGEQLMVHSQYWLDYRAYDADSVRADVATRLAQIELSAPAKEA